LFLSFSSLKNLKMLFQALNIINHQFYHQSSKLGVLIVQEIILAFQNDLYFASVMGACFLGTLVTIGITFVGVCKK
jgi:hypothetical protein